MIFVCLLPSCANVYSLNKTMTDYAIDKKNRQVSWTFCIVYVCCFVFCVDNVTKQLQKKTLNRPPNTDIRYLPIFNDYYLLRHSQGVGERDTNDATGRTFASRWPEC